MESDCRISLFKEKGSQSAKKQMDRVYAWDQPDQFTDLYIMPDHSRDQAAYLVRGNFILLILQTQSWPLSQMRCHQRPATGAILRNLF